MIIAERSDFKRYASINPYFSTVYDFLEKTDLTKLEDGRTDIDGDNVFINSMTYVADGTPGQVFENHKKYLDIHLVVSNTEKMAVSTLENAKLTEEFDEEQDFALYDSDAYQLVTLTDSNLLVVFEEDLHHPKIQVNDEPVRKVVIKVLNVEV